MNSLVADDSDCDRETAINPITFKILISLAIIVIATVHGYGAAWLAIWMLFHPYRPVKLFGVTVWPQGMIPRHRERLAQSIGNEIGRACVGKEGSVVGRGGG